MCSVVNLIYGWGRVEFNIIVCCATERDRNDIGWLWCIAYSNNRKNIGVSGGLWCIIYCNRRAT